MAQYYLGAAFDIHGGGLDLVFPHHENDIAQSRCAGDDFASYWLHNAWVTTAGEKMSKSLGNSLLVSEVCKQVRPIELRWYLASAHYRSAIEFSFQALEESAVAFRRVEAFLERVGRLGSPETPVAELPHDELLASLPAEFVVAMNDDLAVPAALAVLFAEVSAGQQCLVAQDDASAVAAAHRVRSMLAVLGCDPAAPHWGSAGSRSEARAMHALDVLVQDRLADRAAARVARDWAAADSIRDSLSDAGIEIEDTAQGARWSLKDGD